MTRFTQGKSLDHLMDMLANCEPGSVNHSQVTAEITFMQINMQNEALASQKIAADAQVKAANAAIMNARYMLASVIFAALSAMIAAIGVWLHH